MMNVRPASLVHCFDIDTPILPSHDTQVQPLQSHCSSGTNIAFSWTTASLHTKWKLFKAQCSKAQMAGSDVYAVRHLPGQACYDTDLFHNLLVFFNDHL